MTPLAYHPPSVLSDAVSDYFHDLFDAAGILLAANVTFAWQLFDYALGHPVTKPVMELLTGTREECLDGLLTGRR